MNDVRQASVTMVKTEGCRCLSHHAHPHPHYHDDYYNLITCVDWLGAGCQLTGRCWPADPPDYTEPSLLSAGSEAVSGEGEVR